MNNPNNNNRVVINLDGSLDDLDDDDITLPSMPAQSVPIIDEPDSQSEPETLSDKSAEEKQQNNHAVNTEVSSASAAENIALGAPIVSPEVKNETESTPPSDSPASSQPKMRPRNQLYQ